MSEIDARIIGTLALSIPLDDMPHDLNSPLGNSMRSLQNTPLQAGLLLKLLNKEILAIEAYYTHVNAVLDEVLFDDGKVILEEQTSVPPREWPTAHQLKMVGVWSIKVAIALIALVDKTKGIDHYDKYLQPNNMYEEIFSHDDQDDTFERLVGLSTIRIELATHVSTLLDVVSAVFLDPEADDKQLALKETDPRKRMRQTGLSVALISAYKTQTTSQNTPEATELFVRMHSVAARYEFRRKL